MSEYLSKEEIKQWRSSLEKITLEEFAARLGKKIPFISFPFIFVFIKL